MEPLTRFTNVMASTRNLLASLCPCVRPLLIGLFLAVLALPMEALAYSDAEKAQLLEAQKLEDQAADMLNKGKFRAGIPVVQRALAIRTKILGEEAQFVADTLDYLALFYKKSGNKSQAEETYQKALALREKGVGWEESGLVRDLSELGTLRFDRGDLTGAAPLLERALALEEKRLGPDDPGLEERLAKLVRLYIDRNDLAKAALLLERVLAIDQKAPKPVDQDGKLELVLGQIYRKIGEYTKAEPHYLRALSIQEKSLGSENPDLAPLLVEIAALYALDMKDLTKGELFYRRSTAIPKKDSKARPSKTKSKRP